MRFDHSWMRQRNRRTRPQVGRLDSVPRTGEVPGGYGTCLPGLTVTRKPTLPWPRALAACLIAASLLAASPAPAADWPQWRGPERDGRAPGFQAPAAWPDSLRREWRTEVGEGHAGPVVVGDRVYVHARLDDLETLSCLSLSSGEVLWRRTNPAPYEMHPAALGPRQGPQVDAGRRRTGASSLWASPASCPPRRGQRSCCGAGTPRAASPPRRRSSAPPPLPWSSEISWSLTWAVPAAGPCWRWPPTAARSAGAGRGTDRGTPPPSMVDAGGPVLVTQSERFCLALDAATGKELWRRPFTTPYDQNIVTPVLLGPRTVALSGLEQGTLAVRFDRDEKGLQARELWHNPQDWLYMASPVVSGGRLFGLTRKYRGRLFCLDADTGDRLWEGPGELGDNAVFVDLGSALLVLTTEARLAVVSTTAPEFSLLAEYRRGRKSHVGPPGGGRRAVSSSRTGPISPAGGCRPPKAGRPRPEMPQKEGQGERSGGTAPRLLQREDAGDLRSQWPSPAGCRRTCPLR